MGLKKDKLKVASRHAASARNIFAQAADALETANTHLDTVQNTAEQDIAWHRSEIEELTARHDEATRAKNENTSFAQRIRALLEG